MGEKSIQKETEREFKSLLRDEQHLKEIEQKVAGFATFQDSYTQLNHYFDTPDHLTAKSGATVRIREKNNTWTLTVKVSRKTASSLSISEETHISLSEDEAHLYKLHGIPATHPICEALPPLSGTPLLYIGTLKTERTDYQYKEDVISFDVSHYNGFTDYEMEWETTDESFVLQVNFILSLTFGNGKGKRKRFLKTLRR